ncbi:M28 family peptidase [Cytophagaceae bacterium ABcell3]|nr:M28 family peptidase [Cytophagaceae bacterium ABcell3]
MEVQELTQTRLYKDVLRLTKVTPARNYLNISVLNDLSDYIYQEFSRLHCQTFFQEFTVDDRCYRNVIASFGPEKGARVVLGAHYDVAGNQPGADDNASGVAGLLEIARLLHVSEPLKHRVDLVAYCLEEPPYFATDQMGSAFHAKCLRENNIDVKGMICLDMIGYFSDKPNSQGFPKAEYESLYPSVGNYILVVGRNGQEEFTKKVKKLMQDYSQIEVHDISFSEAEKLAGFSDHRNYWKYGYPAVMICDTAYLRNPHYHKFTDIIETLNFEKMAEVVKGVFGAVVNL